MVRELFVMAREHAPSIIFMDETDSIGSARMESGSGNGDSEVQRTMLELLNQLDGFEASNKLKVLMTTNRIEILDQALLRPGRIDRKIEFPNPNEDSRFGILKIHSRKINLMRGIDFKKITEKMSGASGAELKAVCTEAGMFALRERRVHVTQEDFEMSVAKIMKKETEKNASLRKLWSITCTESSILTLDQDDDGTNKEKSQAPCNMPSSQPSDHNQISGKLAAIRSPHDVCMKTSKHAAVRKRESRFTSIVPVGFFPFR
ncbi:26S protease regulatory subunit 8 homolog B [Striga hermonthica]|uniref:26S protease regulatory subunit 8 homolog B n=1 Tax=Striga hermonthica TaxID=68872 RepID=A0A9N7NXL5_STRHE|nr:26S protease regulatory subunit 8 homolog B [Striga hermonthica]